MIEKPRIRRFLVWRNVDLNEVHRLACRRAGVRKHDEVWEYLPIFGYRYFQDGSFLLVLREDPYGRNEEVLFIEEIDLPVDEAARRGVLSEEDAKAIMLNHLYEMLNKILEKSHEDEDQDREDSSDRQD